MKVGGYDFPEIAIDVPADGARWPSIYKADTFGKHSVSFGVTLLPADVVPDLYRIDKHGCVRATSGSPPRVACADMPWLVQQLDEVRASNRHPDQVFRLHKLRLTISPVPLRWIIGSWRDAVIQCSEQTVSLLLENVEIIKPKEEQ